VTLLAFVAGLAIVAVALVEIGRRQHGTTSAVPTPIPSTPAPTSPPTPEPTLAPTPSPAATAAPLPTQNSSLTAQGTTPVTGANPVPAGVAFVVFAAGASAIERHTRRSY
jgi:hypothetical protein